MPEDQVIRYFYNNKAVSLNAAGHIFRYLSAFGDYRFVEDKNNPIIWRDEHDNIPAASRIILGQKVDAEGKGDSTNGRIVLSPDPVEKIFEKIAVRTIFGPYAESKHQPNNDLNESLGMIIIDFFKQLRDAGIIELPLSKVSFWPGGHKFALALTHDVDMIRRSVRGGLRLLFKRDVPGGLEGLRDSIMALFGLASNSYDKIRDWIERENKRELKSTFFIFPGNRKNANDPKYGLSQLKDSIEYIKQKGHGLALHTGIECYRGDNMEESREFIDKSGVFTVTGIRPHYLSASLPDYWRRASELGFQYSSCLGFDEDIGFWNGIDLPFIPFDAEKDAPLAIVEIPIGIMDCGLIKDHPGYNKDAMNGGMELIERVKNTGGILVLDWHQRTMYNTDYPGWADACFDLIEYAREEGAFLTTMGDTARLLKSRMAAR